MKSLPKVAILVLNWNNYQDTKRCLDSLKKLDYPSYSVVLIDNGSTDNSGNRLEKEFPNVNHIKTGKNLGFAGGNNVGIRYILDQYIPYILLLNNDTEVIHPRFLTELINEAEHEKNLGAIGPRIRSVDGTDQDSIFPFPTLGATVKTTLGLYHNDLTQKQYVNSICGCCVLVRTDVITDVGNFDENFFIYGEETEWFYRMGKSGWKIVYLPVLSIIHKGAASSKNIEDNKIYVERRSNIIYTLVKHGFNFQAIMVYVLMNILLVLRIVQVNLSRSNRPDKPYNLGMIPNFYFAVTRKWEIARNSGSLE